VNKAITPGKALSTKEVDARAKRCEAEGLCFISLKPIDLEQVAVLIHPAVGPVRIQPKYA
jgi:hypothetical protein